MGSGETESDRNRAFWDEKLGDRVARPMKVPLSPNDAIRDSLASEAPIQGDLFNPNIIVIERTPPTDQPTDSQGEV